MNRPEIILLTDNTDIITMPKSLGSYKVASELRKHGFDVVVVSHLSVFSLKEIKHLLKSIISDKTLFVGVNNFFYHGIANVTNESGNVSLGAVEPGAILPHGKKYNQELKDFIIRCNPKCKLVLGGPSADDLDYNNIFDYIVVGYGENSVVNLANHLKNQSIPLEKSSRSVFGPTIINDSKAEDYDFVNSNMHYKDYDAILPNETLLIEIGRGCIFKCLFCSYPLNGKKKLDFIRDADLIRDELVDNYNRFGVTRYLFVDDTFNDSVEKCRMIYEISQQLPFKLEWWGYLRLDLLGAHPETIPWLFDSGLKSAFFGVETLNLESAKAIGKGGSREKLISTATKIKKQYGSAISLHASFIFGLPGESIKSMITTKDFLLSDVNPFDSWQIRPLTIRPTNRKYNTDFLSELDQNYEKYGYQNISSIDPDRRLGSHHKEIYGAMNWKNEHTTYTEVLDIVNDVNCQVKNHETLNGWYQFMIAGLGINLDELLNKSQDQIDWHYLDQLKYQRAQEYKRKLFSGLGVPMLDDMDQHNIYTFTNWITSGMPTRE